MDLLCHVQRGVTGVKLHYWNFCGYAQHLIVRLKEYPLLGWFLNTVLPAQQFWLGAHTGFSTTHCWL